MTPNERAKAKQEIRKLSGRSAVLKEIWTAIDLNDISDACLLDTLEALRNPLTKEAKKELRGDDR